jgi:curved DNA-binding protein CbpA
VTIPQDANALRLLYERISAADHFEALGVKREATAAQVKAAYFHLAKTYHPDAAPATEPAPTKKLRADIFARLGEAWRVLGDDASRAAYVEELATGGGAQVDVSAIFEAEQSFQKAVVLVRARQYDKAGALLGDAMKLNPDEPEFTVWKAWVDFLLAADKKRQMAASAATIEAALQKNARCMPGYLFLGQMARLQGDVAVAERHLKRGLALEPDNAELARELKFARK